VLAKRFSFVVIVILLHTLVKIVRLHHCLLVSWSYFFLSFLLPFVVNKDVHWSSYLTLKNIVTLKSGFEVTQGN